MPLIVSSRIMFNYRSVAKYIRPFARDVRRVKSGLQRHILRSQLLKRFRQLQELLLSYRQLACALKGGDELVYCL
jgi:hypothetical protein